MNKLLLIIFFLITFCINLFSTNCKCLYLSKDNAGGWDLPKTNCEYFFSFFNIYGIKCELKELTKENILNSLENDILILSGFGSNYGMFLDNNYSQEYNNNMIYWYEIAKLTNKIIIIDSCYSGRIFDFTKDNTNIIITSTGTEPSWNILDNYNKNISSFVATFRCIYDKYYDCPIDLDYCFENFSLCQFKIILSYLKSLSDNWIYTFYFYEWEYPAIGSALINNKIFKRLD